MRQQAYAPLDAIPLNDLPGSSGTTDDESRRGSLQASRRGLTSSAASLIFDEIDGYSKSVTGDETFEGDARFQSIVAPRGISKRTWSYSAAAIFGLWLIGILIYSSESSRLKAADMWHGSQTNIVPLLDRNVTLNSYTADHKNVSFAEYRRALFYPRFNTIKWLHKNQFPRTPDELARGFYLTFDDKKFVVRQAHLSYEKVILDSIQMNYAGKIHYVDDLILNPGRAVDDSTVVHLVRTEVRRQFRHSTLSHIWLYYPQEGSFKPLTPPGVEEGTLSKIHFASFSPDGYKIVYSFSHDLYLLDLNSMKTTRITTSGAASVLNGKSDWVYEEEVAQADKMLWWSPDLRNLVFAVINDTQVERYNIDYYIKDTNDVALEISDKKRADKVNQYPVHSFINYPKPGTSNPMLQLVHYSVEKSETTFIESVEDDVVGPDFLLHESLWLDNENLLMRVTDRTSSVQLKKLFTPNTSPKARLISTSNSSDFGGWFEPQGSILPIQVKGVTKYFERVVVDNLVQLALFDQPDAVKPARVYGPVSLQSPLRFDAFENCVYGLFGTNLNTTFASVSLDDGLKTDFFSDGKISINLSPDAQFVDLKYEGPGTPDQTIINMAVQDKNAISQADFKSVGLHSVLKLTQDVNLPTRIRRTVKVGKEKVQLNIIEILPPNFKASDKHPLLVHAYGSPGSTTVDEGFLVDFQDIVSSQLNAVVLIIDPRGTGSDDWSMKSLANGKIGFWEPRDIVTVAKDYIQKNKYIDADKTAIWGWSYGGFTALKTMEYDKGQVIKFGMAVAPVTNWMFYDSAYTERYMNLPTDNENYGKTAIIKDYGSFKLIKRFLLMHGTADDNVHIQHSYWLMDHFDRESVENYDVHFFPDSDHSIYYHNANSIIYDKLFWWLQRAFLGVFG